jgi:N-acetyl sugar amidotransferase
VRLAVPHYCQRCILPDTRPGVRLDADGVCAGCRNAGRKREIDWPARAAAFRELVADGKRRAGDWDCLVPVSGGKDSFWQVATCLEHGLRPLCLTFVYPGRNALGERNLRRLRELGVDHFEFRLDPQIERRFIEKAFRQLGISGLVANMAIFTVPLRTALAFGIPLVVYGENSAFEYGATDDRLAGARLDRRWLASFGVSNGTTAEDWIDAELSRRDLAPLMLPPDDVLEARAIRAVFLGHYFRWDPRHSLAIAEQHGFESRREGPRVGHYDFVNIDDDMIGVHHHPKWHKFGITRSWDTLSMEIRAGRLSRDEAIAALRRRGDETPWADIRLFCDYLGMPLREYFEVVEGFRNREIWSRRDGRWVIEGFLVEGFAWPEDPRVE